MLVVRLTPARLGALACKTKSFLCCASSLAPGLACSLSSLVPLAQFCLEGAVLPLTAPCLESPSRRLHERCRRPQRFRRFFLPQDRGLDDRPVRQAFKKQLSVANPRFSALNGREKKIRLAPLPVDYATPDRVAAGRNTKRWCRLTVSAPPKPKLYLRGMAWQVDRTLSYLVLLSKSRF